MESKEEIIDELRELAQRMKDCGAAMDYYGGFDHEVVQHGGELFRAGIIAGDWADEWECEE